jgi:hypothetical protein
MTGDFYFVPGTSAPAQGAVATAPSGTSVDVAALQERLRKLEDEQKRREAAMSPTVKQKVAVALPTLTPAAKPPSSAEIVDNVRFEGLKIKEQRQPSPTACREACEQESGCIAFQHGRRSPVMGQCQLFSRIEARFEDPSWRSGVMDSPGVAHTESGKPATRQSIAAVIGTPMSRRENGFEIYDGLTVMGQQIKMSTADSPAGCQVVCRNTPGCAAAAYSVMKLPSSIIMVRGD